MWNITSSGNARACGRVYIVTYRFNQSVRNAMKRSQYILISLSVLSILTGLSIAGCDQALAPDIPGENDEKILIVTTKALQESEAGVTADGEKVFSRPYRQDSSITISHERVFRYETLILDNVTNWMSEFSGISAALNKASRMEPPTDSTKIQFVFDHVDLGDLALNGTPLNVVTEEEMDFGDTTSVKVEVKFFKWYWYHIFQNVIDRDGQTTIEVDTPLNSVLANNETLTFTGHQSGDVEDFSASFELTPIPKLKSMSSMQEIDFVSEMPKISAANDFTLTFDRPLQARAAYLVFVPFMPEKGMVRHSDIKEKIIMVCIKEETDTIVIPSETLTQVKNNSDQAEELYALNIISFTDNGDIELAVRPEASESASPASYTFPLVQMGTTHMLVTFSN